MYGVILCVEDREQNLSGVEISLAAGGSGGLLSQGLNVAFADTSLG